MSSPSHASTLLEALTLEKLDRGLFRGINVEAWGPNLYGGQVAAQSLAAAAGTVDPDRLPHSLHGYFLRRGRQDLPVIFEVSRDRDGGSFSARHVAAIQEGEVIFSMLASFQRSAEEEWPQFESDLVPFTPPDFEAYEVEHTMHMDLRALRSPTPEDSFDDVHNYLSLRASDPLGDDPMVHASALVYLSDMSSGYFKVFLPGLANGGPSIDHFVYFHEPVRADRWITHQMWPSASSSRRGFYQGHMRGAGGELAAVIGQECLLHQRGKEPKFDRPGPVARAL
jgi:acyl-CoA thioesterase-2